MMGHYKLIIIISSIFEHLSLNKIIYSIVFLKLSVCNFGFVFSWFWTDRVTVKKFDWVIKLKFYSNKKNWKKTSLFQLYSPILDCRVLVQSGKMRWRSISNKVMERKKWGEFQIRICLGSIICVSDFLVKTHKNTRRLCETPHRQ